MSSYAPTSTHSEVEWEAYYDALSAALARRPPNANVIIGADTNASIGIEANLVTMIMTSKALWLGVSGLRESMTPVGAYESSWKLIKSQHFQLSSTSGINQLGRTRFLNVHTKSTTFSLFVKICATFLMLARSVGN